MDKNDEDSLNEEMTESIIELDNIDPKSEEQPRNRLIPVGDRVIRDYEEQ